MDSQLYLTYALVFLGALCAALLLTPLMRKVAFATGQVAVPKESRWHKKETALLGGVAIYMSTTAIWAVGAGYWGWVAFGKPFLVVMAAATAIFLLGLADDLFTMDPQHKLAGQIIISGALMFLGFHLQWTGYKTLDLLLSILWLVGITNAFNLLDNMDGLSAGIAFIAGAFLFAFCVLYPTGIKSHLSILLLMASFLGALLGFLFYNFNPASIFMGDAGSLFIGFLLACLTMQVGSGQIRTAGFMHLISIIAVPIFIVFIPILDTTFVSITRKLFGRRISQGGRDHSSHRLVAIGFSERKAVSILYAFSVVSGLLALAVYRLSSAVALVIAVLYLLFVLFFWIYLGKVRVYSEPSILGQERKGGITPVLVEITYRRRLLEVLLDVALVWLAYYVAYLLRFEGDLKNDFPVFLRSLPVIIAAHILSCYVFGIYRGIWGSAGIRDLMDYAKAVTAGTILTILVLLGLYRFAGFSRAVFVIYWVLMLLFMSLSRLSFRLFDEGLQRRNRSGKKTLIYGAGMGGQMTLREIETNRALGPQAVGFIDDNDKLHGRKIQGYPVLGGKENLIDIIKKYQIQQVIVSFRENGEERKKEIKDLCQKAAPEIKVVRMKLSITE
ncbi:MAG: glycosyl transferase [Deltaproteobacteria bacterium]|nr:MAG: glycosyl transferase [Deltaproteobacteria bacterium]